MKGYTHPNADPDGGYPTTDDLVGQDADTMKKHAEITSDPDRHAAAHQKLKQDHADAGAAVKNSQKQMHGRVKKGLQKAFGGSTGGKTPFQKAGGSGDTPFEKAGE